MEILLFAPPLQTTAVKQTPGGRMTAEEMAALLAGAVVPAAPTPEQARLLAKQHKEENISPLVDFISYWIRNWS